MSSTENKQNYLISAEIGQKLNIIDNKEQKIISENINNKNYLIYNKNGEIINDISKIVEPSNQSNIKDSEYFYLFSKKYEKEKIICILEESNKKLISEFKIQINLDQQNLPDVYTHYNLLEEKASHLKYLNANDIKIKFEKMLEFFENYKLIYTTFKLNSYICENIKTNYKDQNYAINSLINNINKTSELFDLKKNEVINEYE